MGTSEEDQKTVRGTFFRRLASPSGDRRRSRYGSTTGRGACRIWPAFCASCLGRGAGSDATLREAVAQPICIISLVPQKALRFRQMAQQHEGTAAVGHLTGGRKKSSGHPLPSLRMCSLAFAPGRNRPLHDFRFPRIPSCARSARGRSGFLLRLISVCDGLFVGLRRSSGPIRPASASRAFAVLVRRPRRPSIAECRACLARHAGARRPGAGW